MKRPGLSGAMLAVLWLLMSVVTPACAAAGKTAMKSEADLRQHPTNGKTPVDVAVGLYITNFVGIDETRETFEVGGYLTAKWIDPRLVSPANAASDAPATRMFRMNQLWTPSIESANSISHKTSQSLLSADRSGLVTYIERFDATLSSDFDLRKFPFDTQNLRFQFHPFLSGASETRFAAPASALHRHQPRATYGVGSLAH